jgi:protein-arginine deiminase
MFGKILVTTVCGAFMGANAQSLDLRGRVVQANGSPIAEATVELKTLGKSVRTASDGTFSLNGNTALNPTSRQDFEYRLDPEFLWVESRTELPVRMEIFDLSGQALGCLSRSLPAGSSRIALSESMNAPGRGAGLYVLRIRLGSRTFTRRILRPGLASLRTRFSESAGPAAAKRAAGVDTLRIRKSGFKDFVLEIPGYTAGNLGDLTLIDLGNGAFAVLTDTDRDGIIGEKDAEGFTDWAWKGAGAFFIANMDDDDGDGKVDAADQTVNGTEDEKDLARIRVKVPADLLAKAKSISATVTAGASQVRLFEKTAAGWKAATGALSQVAADAELGIEAVQFAGSGWDGIASVRLDLADAQGASLGSRTVKLRVAPWIMLPNSAKTELVYISSTTRNLRPGIDAVLTRLNLPACKASNPPSQDVWFQDTMEMGYTQIPGLPPMHVVMNAVRGNSADNLAPTLLAPGIGLITVAKTRNLDGEDHWMDWMGDLEVTSPVPGYPLGRIYHGKSPRTTYHPDIVKFLEAQEVQKPFAVNTGWLVIQHVDEIFTFVPDKEGKGKMVIVSPEAASKVTPSGYDAGNQQIQGIINDIIKSAKTELGLTDADIIPLAAYFGGSGTDYSPTWSSPVNFIHVNGTIVIGQTDMPAAIKSDIEKKFTALGLQTAWVDDSEYHPGGGNVHCGTNTKKTPVCGNFADCL